MTNPASPHECELVQLRHENGDVTVECLECGWDVQFVLVGCIQREKL